MRSKKIKKVLPAMNFVGDIMVCRGSQNLLLGSQRQVILGYGDCKIESSVVKNGILFICIL